MLRQEIGLEMIKEHCVRKSIGHGTVTEPSDYFRAGTDTGYSKGVASLNTPICPPGKQGRSKGHEQGMGRRKRGKRQAPEKSGGGAGR